jgi:pantoate--beta-alanine ligase
MQIIQTIAEMRRASSRARDTTLFPMTAPLAHAQSGAHRPPQLALVPTMGALHDGHISLVRAARRAARSVAVSLFVNPTQFAPGEDLARYPRTWAEDVELLEREKVDLLFAPPPEEMYPTGSAGTFIEVPGISDRLDGASRPGHFRGVATVVAKLFSIVQPQLAFFGQKDAAQLAVLRAMTVDLDLPVEIRACPIIRSPDGLALSSRNRYLSAEERQIALAVPRSLDQVTRLIKAGTTDAATLREALVRSLAGAPALRLDYAEIVDPDTLLPVPVVHPRALVAVAVWVGTTRLIDNLLVEGKP